MINKYVNVSTKSESSKPPEEDEIETRNTTLLYRNNINPERDKSSDVSSDEETTSSSIVPIPESLRQMRNELKKTISDIGEPSEVETYRTCGAVEKSSEKVQTLDELRKKYTFKRESSVALKVNSANLMLDDILNHSNLSRTCKENLQPKFYAQKNCKAHAMVENESSTDSSKLSAKYCHYHSPTPAKKHSFHQTSSGLHQPHCEKHNKAHQSVCNFVKTPEKKQIETQVVPQKKKSFFEKIQNLQFKYRIMSVYKLVQNSNLFAPGKKVLQIPNSQQGIPKSSEENEEIAPGDNLCKCEAGKMSQYPRRMIFDLVESSDVSQSDDKSTERDELRCTCELKCTCPEVIPRCIYEGCTCKILESLPAVKETSPRTLSSKKSGMISNTEESLQIESAISMIPEPQKEINLVNEQNVIRTEIRSESKNEIKKQDNVSVTNESTNIQSKDFPEKSQEWKKRCVKERKLIERTDIYYFDHGNSAYYRTTDNHPIRCTECLVERTDQYATKFWAEIFGFFEIGVAFIITFVLQLFRFVFASIVRALTVGLLQIISDYCIKPILTILFNGILQPCLILGYNFSTSCRDLCLPISQTFGFFAKEFGLFCKSCRLVEYNRDCCSKQSSCNCGNKV